MDNIQNCDKCYVVRGSCAVHWPRRQAHQKVWKLGPQNSDTSGAAMAAISGGLDRKVFRQQGFINVARSKFSANTDPGGYTLPLFSCFCADKSQDVPREQERKAKA
jgi:hypothetical protein